MGIIARLFGRKSRTSGVSRGAAAQPTPPAPKAQERRSYTVRLPGGVVETRFVEPSTGTFDDWVAEMEAKRTPEEPLRVVESVTIDESGLLTLDLREVPSSRFRIVGSAYCVTEAEREEFGATDYLLKREPDNENDTNAVAVFGKGRKVGYLSAAKAAAIAATLDGLGFEVYQVGGTAVLGNSVRLWVDIPKSADLRRFVAGRNGGAMH